MLNNKYVDLLKALIRQPCIVGAELSFFGVLQDEFKEPAAKLTWYEGLLLTLGRKPFSTMLSAHIDRHGLICTTPGEFQYAAFITAHRSDLLNTSVSEQLKTKVTERFLSKQVYAYKAWLCVYRGSGYIKNASVCQFRNNLIFKVHGLDDIVTGTPEVFKDKHKINNHRLEEQMLSPGEKDASKLIEVLCRKNNINYTYKDKYLEEKIH